MSKPKPSFAPVAASSSAEATCREGALSLARAGRFCGVSKAVIYELVKAGKLPSLPFGRRRVIPKQALVALMARLLEAEVEKQASASGRAR